MTLPSRVRPGDPTPLRVPPREPYWQPVRPPFRPSPLPDRRFQKRPVTTLARPGTLPGSMTVCIAAASFRLQQIMVLLTGV